VISDSIGIVPALAFNYRLHHVGRDAVLLRIVADAVMDRFRLSDFYKDLLGWFLLRFDCWRIRELEWNECEQGCNWIDEIFYREKLDRAIGSRCCPNQREKDADCRHGHIPLCGCRPRAQSCLSPYMNGGSVEPHAFTLASDWSC
jgi:hypothetical protein